VEQDGLPVAPPLLGEGGERRAGRTHGLDVVGNVPGLARQPVHGGHREAEVERPGGQDAVVERGHGGRDVAVVEAGDGAGLCGESVDQAEDRVVVVARLVRVDEADRPVRPAPPHGGQRLAHHVG